MTYEEKLKIYQEEFDLCGTQIEGRIRFKLYSLVCILTMAAKKKDPKVNAKQLITKILPAETSPLLLEKIGIQCDSLLTNQKFGSKVDFDSYGFTTAKDMASEIRNIVDLWLPF